jgi:hypothetical protein
MLIQRLLELYSIYKEQGGELGFIDFVLEVES